MHHTARLVRHYAGVMAHEFDSVPADDAEVLGILAYSSLAFMTRLAKDGEQAPHVRGSRGACAHGGALLQALPAAGGVE